MPAYFVIELPVEEGEVIAEYEDHATAPVLEAGGRFLIRGNTYRPLEGDWHPARLVVMEFPDLDAVERFYNSETNQRLRKIRERATGGKPARAIAIEGLAGATPENIGRDATGAIIWR
jgi:uncharacterized protein (DUF1330 family)